MTTENFTLTGYEIVDRIYSGTRTLVYRGIRTSDKQPVAIKVLRSKYPSFTELVQFRNQYTIAKNLNLPGIIETYSLEAYQNSYALIMEDFGGISLQESIQQGETLPNLRDFLQMAIDISNTLDILCRHRIIHKDIKPANILINPQTKQVKLIDFSIASLLPRETQTLMNPNVLEGTLGYLSPEQTGRMNRGIDYRTDFYSLGVTFYELLAGELPFQSNDPMELVHCHIAKQSRSLHEIKPEIPSALSEIVSKLMAKNAEDRYQSALGLKFDLEFCLRQLEESGQIGSFAIAQRDLCDRFNIPEKLYGRETEVKALLNAFDRVSTPLSSARSSGGQRAVELMLVAGFSGIGKTAVVNEVHKPIVRQRGYFIKGKFDQFNRNIPFSAFVQAFRDLMRQLLSESDAQLQTWKSQILAAVGENGQVLMDVIPELEQIIGKQPSAPELSGSAAQNRFNLLFQKFVEVFTTAEHPLVLFLDDLQWADLASLQLLKLLMNDNGYLLIFGAYRDNEVSPVHPFILTVEELKKAQNTVQTITLEPLAFADTNHLVADTLNCSRELAQPLTALIDRKTQGNPFFTTQFLKALYEGGYIRFDRDRRHWECDIAQVNALSLTDDVVEFMAQQLQKLPAETQQVLKLAACVGNQFDLATLAIVSEQSPIDTATVLWKALQEGLILPTSQVYKFFQSSEQTDTQTNVNPAYRFLHDRVQQAADSLIPEDQKQSTHVKIGQLLLQKLTAEEREEKLFDIVNHFNSGKALLVNPDDRDECARLNLMAGQKAKISTSYNAAFDYLTTGIELLSPTCWQTQYDLALTLQTEAAEVAYLGGRFEELDAIAHTVLTSAKTFLDKIKIYETQIQAYLAQNKLNLALQIGQTTLKSLDIRIPKQANMAKVLVELAKTKLILAGKKIPDLVNLPIMQAPKDLASMRILASTLSAAYIMAPKLLPILAFKQVNLSVKRGNTALSAFAYTWYGTILSGVLLDIETGYQFGQLAIQVQEKLNAKEMRCKVVFMVNCFMQHWKDPIQNTIAPLQAAYQAGLETGDLEYASWAVLVRAKHLYYLGHSLLELAPDMKGYAEAVRQFKQNNALVYLNIYRQTVENLLGKSANPEDLTGSCYSEKTDLPMQVEAGDRTGLAFSYITQLELCYRFGNFTKALQKADLAKQYEEACAGLLTTVPLYLYDSLTQLVLYPDATKSKQQRILKRVVANQKKMKIWAQFAPENHQHKYDLIEAERQRVLDNKIVAIELYDRAISGAKTNNFIQEEALANELAAKFYLEWGKEKVAAGYMQEAYYCYAKWGALAKINDLEKRYPQLLQPILLQAKQPLSVLETLISITASDPSIHSNTRKTSTSNSLNHTLDFAALLKVSQTLSSTIELDELLQILTQRMLENSGANKCALMLPQEGEWQVRVMAELEQITLQTVPLEDNANLPVKLIQYVKNTLTAIAIDDIDTNLPVIDNYLSQHQPQSVLCLPILDRGNLVSILYLENRSTSGVFARDRILVLNFLCTQAAISLENARLYRQSQQMLEDLQQAQLQLIQSEKMSALGNLVAGVAHEINNPIGCIVGNVGAAQDYINDLLGIIDLYGEKFPQPGVEIEDELEELDLDYVRSDLPKLIKSMKDGGDRIKSISQSLRTFSRADSDTKQKFNLHDGIDSTVLILRHRLKANEHRPAIEVVTEYGNIPEIACFPGQLNQVFMNIIANAIDALDESNSGRSFAEIKANPNRITIRTSVEKEQVKIDLADNGTGISSEVKSQIFDHLFTTKSVGKGTGLGLAIAQQIVIEKHGGTIQVDSVLGQGTIFTLQLPLEA
jgi:predicted ATPase/signal transduction histidine kinase